MDSADRPVADEDRRRVLGAMRSGEWLRTQWIARVAFDLGTRPWNPKYGARVLAVLRPLEAGGEVEQRETEETRIGPVADVIVALRVPRWEWRLRCAHYDFCMDRFEETREQIRALPETPEPPSVALVRLLRERDIDPRTATWGDLARVLDPGGRRLVPIPDELRRQLERFPKSG